MANIRIEWLTDCYDSCETCGPSYAVGARVYVDEQLVLDMTPGAHCMGGTNYESDEVFRELFNHLGHSVIEEY